MKTTALLCLALLTGCAAQVTSSTPRSVVINAGKPPIGAGAAQALADAECKKHERFARMTARPLYGMANDYVFDCVQ